MSKRNISRTGSSRVFLPLVALIILGLVLVTEPSYVHANGLTSVIAEGTVGSFDYTVGVGLYSEQRGLLLMAVSLSSSSDQRPISDAEVYVRGLVDGGASVVGPLQACNSPFHPSTYDLWFSFSPSPREIVRFEIEVDSSYGQEAFVAEMIVPQTLGNTGKVDSDEGELIHRSSMRCHQDFGPGRSEIFLGAVLLVVVLLLGSLGMGLHRSKQ